ncbi:MAG: carboxylating nicotinate-nucleotide diphosphorylase [Phycisphaerae bacterium]
MIASPPLDESIRELIALAVCEDLGVAPEAGNKTAAAAAVRDRTVALTIPSDLTATGKIVARKPGVICGTFLTPAVLAHYDRRLQCLIHIADGHTAAAGAVIAQISGPAGALLSAERVVLNFLGRLSGIATLTSQFVAAAGSGANQVGSQPMICDTRKTTPGWRNLEKYAVRCGGGINHRMGLYDGVMLKDNHLAALRRKSASSLSYAAITRNMREHLPPGITLWLEVDTLAQLQEALPGAADIILLDNMSVDQLRQAVLRRDAFRPGGPPLLEASGGVTLNTIAAIAATGVDRISVGALTHSAPSLDLGMDFIEND